MKPDLLDPFDTDKKPESENPAGNPFENPGERAFGDDGDESAPMPSFKPYELGGAPNLAQQEAAGSATNSAKTSTSKDPELKYLQKLQENPNVSRARSKASSVMNSMTTSKKRAAALLASVLGVGLVGFFLFAMFMVVSGFGVKQAAAIADGANFARLHISSYRRTSQYTTEKLLNPEGSGFKISGVKRTWFDRFAKWNPTEELITLRQADQFAVITKDGKKRVLGVGPKLKTTDIEYVFVGKEYIPAPSKKSLNPTKFLENYRNEKAYVKNVERAADEADLFRGKSKYLRTKGVNAILQEDGMKLSRWTDAGRKIKTFKDAITSARDRLKPKEKVSVSNSDLQDIDEKIDEKIKATPDDAVVSGEGLVSGATDDVAKDIAKNPIKGAAGKLSFSVLLASLYCTSRDYIDGKKTEAENKAGQYVRAGGLLQSTSSQIESGDITTTALTLEAKRISGFDKSPEYQEDAGNTQAAGVASSLTSEDAPVVQDGGVLYKFMEKIKQAGDSINPTTAPGVSSIPGVSDLGESITDGACKGVNSTAGQVLLAVAENALGAVAASFSGGASAAAKTGGQEAVEVGLKEALQTGISSLGKQELKQFGRGAAKDIAIFIGVDLLVKTVLGGGGNAASSPPEKAYAQASVGSAMITNQIQTSLGGRNLDQQEARDLSAMVTQRRVAARLKKPLWERIASLSDPYSAASQTVATLPYDMSSLKSKSLAFAGGSLNPMQTVASNTNRLAVAASGSNSNSGTVYATAQYDRLAKLGIPTVGWSPSEMEKMLEPSFWPTANAEIVEANPERFSKFDGCFKPDSKTPKHPCEAKTEDLKTDDGIHARLYQMDGGNAGTDESASSDINDGLIGGHLDAQKVTAQTSSGSSTTSTTAPSAVASDTSGTPCQGGSRELGISTDLGPGYEAYSDGKLIKIKLCAITTIKGSSDESNSTVKGVGVPNANGQAIVSSIASGAWQELGKKAQAAGKQLSAGSSWRTMAHQEQLCRDDKKNGGEGDCPNGNYNDVAKPGTSNHQSGTAIDISEIYNSVGGKAATDATCSAPKKSTHPTYIWVAANARALGIKNYANEPWHWGTSEQC